jgi:hypothetical protein
MKTLKILHQSDESNNEMTPKVVRPGKLLLSVLIIFMFSCITLLPSCYVLLGTPRSERHRVSNERHDRGEHRDNNEHHNNDEHHD